MLRLVRRWRFVLEIRDIWPESITTVGAMRKSATVRLLEHLERWMYRRADRIVAVGEGYREKLIERGVSADKVTVVTNGVDREVFAPRDPDVELRARYGWSDKTTFAYIGTVGMAAGLDVVLRAARTLLERGRADVHFVIVGDGAERASLSARAAEAMKARPRSGLALRPV